MDVTKLCRSCMTEVPLWEIGNFDPKVVKMFGFCTSIEITEDDKLPRQFCYECTVKIDSSYAYIKRAQEVDIELQKLVLSASEVNKSEPIQVVEDFENEDNIKFEVELCDEAPCDSNSEKIINELKVEKDDYKPKKVRKKKILTPRKSNQRKAEFESNTNKPTEVTSGENKADFDDKRCKICKKVFLSMLRLSKHMSSVHIRKKVLQNQNSESGGASQNSLQNKVGGDSKELYRCPECLKSFMKKGWFTQHMEREHSGRKHRFQCKHCLESFPTEHYYRAHIESHTELKLFGCETCGRKFRKPTQLAEHELTHGDDRPYACNKCGVKFKLKSEKMKHLKDDHQDEKPYLCTVCGKNFRTVSTLKHHQRSHSTEKSLQCSQCEYRTRYEITMRRHMRQHRGDKPYVCPYCHKQFYDLGAVARHKRIHTGEKPYKCPMCSDAFIDSWKRRLHLMRTHKMELGDIPRLNRAGEPAPL